jgi:hypothetical protein
MATFFSDLLSASKQHDLCLNDKFLNFLCLFLAPNITTTKLVYDVPDDNSTNATLRCKASGFPQPKILWMFQNVSLITGEVYRVNTTEVPNANLTQLSDGVVEVMSTDRHGGFGVDVVCFANNTVGETQESFLVRFVKGIKRFGYIRGVVSGRNVY